jgi:hypothetical protein
LMCGSSQRSSNFVFGTAFGFYSFWLVKWYDNINNESYRTNFN